jgi:hypothetical protein
MSKAMRCAFDAVVAGRKYHMRLGIGGSLTRWRWQGAGIPVPEFRQEHSHGSRDVQDLADARRHNCASMAGERQLLF